MLRRRSRRVRRRPRHHPLARWCLRRRQPRPRLYRQWCTKRSHKLQRGSASSRPRSHYRWKWTLTRRTGWRRFCRHLASPAFCQLSPCSLPGRHHHHHHHHQQQQQQQRQQQQQQQQRSRSWTTSSSERVTSERVMNSGEGEDALTLLPDCAWAAGSAWAAGTAIGSLRWLSQRSPGGATSNAAQRALFTQRLDARATLAQQAVRAGITCDRPLSVSLCVSSAHPRWAC